MSPLKVEFSTVRELEKKTYRVFGYGGAAFVAGLVLTIAGVALLGAPIMLISAVFVIGAIIWVSVLGKEPARTLFCPYCASQNDVYQSRRSFNCDICNRPILVSETGEAVAADPIDVEARYKSSTGQ